MAIPIEAAEQSINDETPHQALNNQDSADLIASVGAWIRRIGAICGVTAPGLSTEQTAAWLKCYSKTTGFEANGAPVPSYDPLRVRVLYSVDNSVCTTVASLYSALGHRSDSHHPPGHNPSNGWFWEVKYAGEFRKVGFVEPARLRSIGSNPDRPGGWYGLSFAYKLRLAPSLGPQIVWISDMPWRRSEVSTNVVVLKAGKDFDDQFWDHSARSNGVDADDINAEAVELGILFNDAKHSPAFRFYALPYLFRDGGIFEKYDDVDWKGRPYALETYPALDSGTNVIQRVYIFHHQAIFIANEGNGRRILVYRLKDGKTKEDVCYLGQNLRARR